MRHALLPLSLVFLFLPQFYFRDGNWPIWGVAAALSVVLLSLDLRRMDWSWQLLCLWLGLTAVAKAFFWPYLNSSAENAMAIQALSSSSGFLAIGMVTVANRNWVAFRTKALNWIIAAGAIHCALLFFQMHIWNPLAPTYGLLDNHSMGTSFVAVWVFLCWHRFMESKGRFLIPFVLFGIGTVLLGRSAISVVALFAGLAGAAISLGVNKIQTAAASALCAIFAAGLAGPLVDKDFFSWIDRYDFWPAFLGAWWGRGAIFGDGLGTFQYFGPASQAMYELGTHRVWLYAHNDWLELLLEGGVIGLLLGLLVYLRCLWKVRSYPAMFAALSSGGVLMCGNYPWQSAPFAVVCLWLVHESFSIGKSLPDILSMELGVTCKSAS